MLCVLLFHKLLMDILLPFSQFSGRYITLIILIIGGLAVAVTVGWTLATIVVVDFNPSK